MQLRLGWVALLALAAGGLVFAQGAAPTSCVENEARWTRTLLDAKDLSYPAYRVDAGSWADARAGKACGTAWDAQLGLLGWDHSLQGAFELGERLMRLASPVALPGARGSAATATGSVLRLSAYGSPPKASLDAIAKALRIDQLERQGMNLRMSSPFGNFRFQYREIFTARANTLGGGVGQASAAASWTAPRFGAGGLFNFTAAALMGTGLINQLLGNGFGSSAIGGNGPGRKSSTAPTVAIKLTF